MCSKLSKLRQIDRARRALPIYAYKGDIVAAVRAHQLVIVAGDTGCGKSTQVLACFLMHFSLPVHFFTFLSTTGVHEHVPVDSKTNIEAIFWSNI